MRRESAATSQAAGDVAFVVMRAEGREGAFREALWQEVEIEGELCTFTDRDCEYGASYRYRVDCLTAGGRSVLFETGLVCIPPLPLELRQNYPNPFNPVTTIRFTLGEDAWVRLEVFDVAGRKLAVLVDGYRAVGIHDVEWDARTLAGKQLSGGVYLYRLQTGKESASRKMVLLK